MITKGYIVGKSTQSSNKYLVRIPIFESAGIGQTNNELNSSVSECTLSHNPGTYEALKPGDCVFVSFEDNRFSRPIILGKLFVNVEEQSSGYQYNTDLKVTHKATLPVDTTIGNVPFDNILNYFESINTAIDRLSTQTTASANITLFSTTTASDVSGYFKLVSSVDSPDYNQTAVDVPTGIINTNNQLVGQLISEPNLIVGNPGTINITTIGNIKRTAGNNNQYVAFYFKIFKRSSLGVETEIVTSNETPNIIIGNIYEEFSASALLDNVTFTSTDRIVIKYFANLTGNSGSNYDFQFGGSNPVRTLFPVPISSIPTPLASAILTNTTNFNGLLSSSDNNVQKALDKIDDNSVRINNIKTINGISLVGTGNINISSPSDPLMPKIRLTSFGAKNNDSGGISPTNPLAVRFYIEDTSKLQVGDEITLNVKYRSTHNNKNDGYRFKQVLIHVITLSDIESIQSNVLSIYFTEIAKVKYFTRSFYGTYYENQIARPSVGYTTLYLRIRRCPTSYSVITTGVGRSTAIFSNMIPIRVYIGIVPSGAGPSTPLQYFIRSGD